MGLGDGGGGDVLLPAAMEGEIDGLEVVMKLPQTAAGS